VNAEVPLPFKIPVKVVAPVPPLATATVPVTLAALPLMLPVILEPAKDVIHVGSA